MRNDCYGSPSPKCNLLAKSTLKEQEAKKYFKQIIVCVERLSRDDDLTHTHNGLKIKIEETFLLPEEFSSFMSTLRRKASTAHPARPVKYKGKFLCK